MTPSSSEIGNQVASVIAGQIEALPWHRRHIERRLKRGLDFFVALALILLLWPVMVMVALLVRITSPGPIFFRQDRLGINGQRYQMVKFRSMEARLPDGSAGVNGEVTVADSRLTPIGAILRAWRLDELPQLFQVLSGEMSLVGPRPDIETNLPNYTDEQMLRFAMPPGCTAWTFTRGAFANDWQTRQDINVDYVREWSLWLDLSILFGSFFVLLLQRNTNPQSPSGSQTMSQDQNG